MSQWNSGVPANPPTSQGQVAFYDPTKFQKGASDFPNIPTSSQQNHVDTSSASDASGIYNNQGENPPTSNSWSSWGAWDPNSAAYNNLGQTGQAGQANTDENQTGNEFGGYNQQWYGNQQWNQNGMVWDPNSQQWVQYNYQPNDANYQQGDANYQQGDANYQQGDANYQQGQNNQYPGYNQYWTGDAGVNGQQNVNYNGDFQQVGAGDQSVPQGNVYAQNYQGNMPHSSTNEVPVSDESATTGGVVSEDTDEQTDDLDESQSTEPTTETESSDNQSLNRSLGNYEEGVLDGYTQSEELVHENENKTNEQVYHGDAVNFGENFSNNGAGMSAMDSQGFDLSGQMQAVSLHDNNQTDHIRSESGLNHANLPVSSQQQYPNVPFVQPPVTGSEFPYQSQQVPVIDNTDAVSSFSDWEMVPPQPKEVIAPFVPEVSTVVSSEPQTLMAPSHSRNASLDDNVHFFIGSNASSTRVSPSAKPDDAGVTVPSNSAGQDEKAPVSSIPNSEAQNVNPGYNTVPVVQEETISQSVVSDSFAPPGPSIDTPPTSTSHPPEQAPPPAGVEAPPSGPQAPPPMMIGVNKGGNPYRKSPFTDSTAENSMLSSTRYDMTQPNYENSPVLLNQSISPIPPEMQKQDKKNDPSPEITSSKPPQSVTDTPVSTGKKPSGIPESPIMPRKESPFQPPGKNKPLKASHDIGVSKKSEDTKENIPSNGNPDKDRSSEERSSDRRSNDRESSKRYEGRRTPDWDSRRRDNAGRRTPDWDRRRPDRGRRTPEWDSRDDRNRDGSDRDRHRRYEDDDRDRVTSRPPRPNNDNDRGDRGQSSRTRQSAFHQIQNNRGKNNVSPATSLWDAPEGISNVSNILLVPQTSDMQTSQPGTSAPSVLTPVASLITSLSEQIKTEDKSDSNSKGQNMSDNKHNSLKDTRDSKDKYRDRDADRGRDRDNDDRDVRGNRSYESLRDRDRSFKDSRTNSREKLSMYSSRNSLDDDPRDRSRRGDSRERERSYRDKDYYDRYRDRDRDRDRDRPPSRNGSTVDGYGRRDYRDRDRDRDSYRDREYYSRKYDRDRPRSRQGDRDRPPSRQTEGERPRSRGGEYDKESSYYRDKYRTGYDYDDYYRRNYYDRQYYDYYYGQQYGQGGYYDEHGYYHTDQRYHYDYHQKRSRTGTPGSLSDGGEEISKIEEKSKKSDKKGEKKRFDYPPDLHDYSHRGHYDSYYGYYDYDQSGYRWDPHISQWVATTATEVEPQRQTPEKFMYPHVRAAFGPNGQLIKVLPNGPADGQPATVEIHDVQALLEENEESEELRGFPGPLVRGDTHKNDVLLFCQQQAQSCTENMELEDRESAELIWRFLELMIKQNGTVVGTDIADLLLKGHEPTTLDYKRTGMKIASSTDNLDIDEEGSEGRVSRGTTPIDRSLVNRGKSVDDVTDRFRHLLLYGRKKDAIDWAMKNHLWGHALFLASKMDTRMHANVMTRFANVAMRMNDPLQTLYQLMSGRQPAAVTSVGEEKWGDWRPHLAMILSNHSAKPDLDRKSITQLGDTLASRGFLHASHFCYLMSQTSFGSYNKKSSKIVLVGSSHSLPLELFANNQAIQCTEIYEYALALGNTAVSLANFQYFKYLYCTRLIDYGLAQEGRQNQVLFGRGLNIEFEGQSVVKWSPICINAALYKLLQVTKKQLENNMDPDQTALQYCEVISKHINMNPAFYQHVLVKLVYDMSSQLKFADPHIQESGDDDTPDPDWLRELHTTLVQFEEGAIQCISGSVTPAYMGTTASSESGEVGMILQGTDTSAGYHQEMYMNKTDHTQHYQTNVMGDQSQYNAQYGQEQYGYHQGVADMSQYPSNMTSHDPNTDQSHHPEQYQSGVDGNQLQQGTSIYQQQQDAGNHVENNGYQPNMETNNYAGEGLQWPSQNSQQTKNQQSRHMTGHMGYESTNQNTDVNTTTQHAFTTQGQTTQSMGHYQPYGTNHHQPNFPSNVNLGESQTSQASTRTHRSSSLASTTEDDEGQDTMDGGYLGQGHNQGIFDLQPAQQKIVAPPLRKRTVSESSNGSTGGVSKPSSMTSRNQTSKTEDKKGIVSQADTKGKQGGGLFAKIGGLFARSKNEMKLPDDKEPSIVWDPVQKRWIDKDADEADLAPAAPPPKDTDLSGPAQAPPAPSVNSTIPSSSMPPPAPPAGGNKYSRRKGLGARGQYVDVMNPKPSSNSQVPTNLFSTLPSVHSAPAIFNPTGNDSSSSVPSTQASEPIQEEKSSTGPDPSSSHSQGGLSAPPASENLSRTSSRSSLSREIQEILGKNDPSAPIQTSLPTMFNPAQFQNNQLNKAPAAGPGHRLSNRRVYPK